MTRPDNRKDLGRFSSRDMRCPREIDHALADLVADGVDAGVRLGADVPMAIVGAPDYFRNHPPLHYRRSPSIIAINLGLPGSRRAFRLLLDTLRYRGWTPVGVRRRMAATIVSTASAGSGCGNMIGVRTAATAATGSTADRRPSR